MKIVRRPEGWEGPAPGTWQPDRPAHLRDTWPDLNAHRIRMSKSGLHRFKDAVLKLIGAAR